ncbi:MAG: hypothetical protein QOJ22_92 [Thermoleophilaceae bacterium]|nr:hypothetical protein [Thermoleophilaceae bacterium]
MDAAKQAKVEQMYRDAVQPHTTEPVLAAWMFYRSGSFAKVALTQVSGLGALAAGALGKKKAAGLPQTFVLAVTPTHVRAFKAKPRGFGVKVGDELLSWDRRGLTVTAQQATVNTTVTLQPSGEGETVVCSTGKDEASLAMIRAMQEPVAA